LAFDRHGRGVAEVQSVEMDFPVIASAGIDDRAEGVDFVGAAVIDGPRAGGDVEARWA